MEKFNFKQIKINPLKSLAALLLIGALVFSGLPTEIQAEGSYSTNFLWDKTEEVLHEWPLDVGLTPTHLGIGTAGFAYTRYYYNDTGRIVLEFDFSIFPDDPTGYNFGSKYTTFRDQWKNANIFIDPDLVSKVDNAASFFMMSYPTDNKTEYLDKAMISGPYNNIYKLDVKDVFPKMPTGSDYMKSKLYLILKSGVTRAQLNDDYAVQLRYTNNQNQVYNQTGSKGLQVLGVYNGYTAALPTFDVSVNNDDVTLKTVAPFQTASMPGIIPNPVLPPDMMRTVAQSVIYDNINGKLIVYYKQAPNHYIYNTDGIYANDGYFLSSWIGIRQVMDSRIYNALKPDENGVVGQMRMLDLNGIPGNNWSVSTDIKSNEFSYTPVTPDVGTYSYMMVPKGFKTDVAKKATVPANQTNNVKNVYLHGHKKEADYVRFIYNVDKNKMDALFKEANSSTLSISTSYITDRPTETTQTEYRLTTTENIVIPKGAYIIFELPKDSRSVFKAGSENNYERIIGNMETRRPKSEMNNTNVDPTDFGKAYTIAPYYGTSDGFVLMSETGLTIPSGDTISLTMFDATSPATVKMTVSDNIFGIGGAQYTLGKLLVNQNRFYTMPNAHVRSGIIINRSANTPHIDEFFTDSTTVTGYSKYPNALVSMRKAVDDVVFREAISSATSQVFTVGGADLTGYAFAFDVPADTQLKKDMDLRFANAAEGYFRSVPATYRTQAKVTFDFSHATGGTEERVVPINQKAYGETGYSANGFMGDNILWLDSSGNAVPASTAVKYLSDYEGRPITDTASEAHTRRQFYNAPPGRAGYTFLGWSTKKVDSMGSTAFNNLPTLTDVAGWDEAINYKFTANSPVDQSRTVYAVWERDLYQYNIVLHSNGDGPDTTHTVELPLSVVEAGIGELTTYLKKAGNILYDKGFEKNDAYFVGWSETATVVGTTQVHELYTNASKVKLDGGNFQLQLNEEPKDDYSGGHIIQWKTVPVVNDNGIATIDLYAQYKPLITMTATKNWYAKGQKDIYAGNPEGYTGQPEAPHFNNSDVAMVLLRTTEGKSLDPTKYEIIEGFYKKGTDGTQWQWNPQEGHDANGRKYSYLMTEFNAGSYTEDQIIEHFKNKKTWASMYITMIGDSNYLSKWTAISFVNTSNETKSYMAVATSNQPTAVQTVNTTTDYVFELKNFEVDVLPPIIHRIQDNHTEIVINNPTDGAKYLYLSLDDCNTRILFAKDDYGEWSLQSGTNLQIIKSNDGKLLTISSTADPLSFTKNEWIYALFTITTADPGTDTTKYASRQVKAHEDLPGLLEVKQEPHIKDVDGNITHNVVSAKIPAGSYDGAKYTLGYMSGIDFIALKDGGNDIKATPDALGKLIFNVPEGILNEGTQYFIRGEDPAGMFKTTDFDEPVTMDLTAPAIDAFGFTLITGDLIGPTQGLVTITDSSLFKYSYKITKDGNEVALPEGITFDPITGKFYGKTADVLPAGQCGDYEIAITAEDIYGNVSTKSITLAITQKQTTPGIDSIIQNTNDSEGNAVITIQGIKGATIKLYSESGGVFTEIVIPGISDSEITNADGTKDITLSRVDLKRFDNGKIYLTQKEKNKLESGKADYMGETIYRKDEKKVVTGGAISIDNIPPTPLQFVHPLAGTDTLKITNVSADDNLPDVKDIHKIILKIGNNTPCILTRQYDVTGEPTGKWTCNKGYEFEETEELASVIVNPNTGETETKRVGVLNFKFSGMKFEEYQVISATYYDYLGNASATVTTTVPKLCSPVSPYEMTASNNSQLYPDKTVIRGMADPGAVVYVTLGFRTYKANVNELGEFVLEIPKQAAGTVITVTSKLNNYTKEAKVTVGDEFYYDATGGPGRSITPRTGDIGSAYDWIGLAVVLSGIIFLVIRRKRKVSDK